MVRLFSPERTLPGGVAGGSPWPLNDGLLQEVPFHLPPGFLWRTPESPLLQTGEQFPS